ncbi:hypothetical protein B5S32_g4534 [[Candida] boidinii]|nr:hypothetical protein B5S32_g4534 [[Candida] boidinii]
MEAQQVHSYTCRDWVLDLCQLKNHGIVSSMSDGGLNLSPFDFTKNTIYRIPNAHSNSINRMRNIDYENLVATCARDSVKIWDFRCYNSGAVSTLTGDSNSNFLSVDSRHGFIAGGSELQGVDAELHIWDMRANNKPVRVFKDSHHDDITEIRFHPTNKDLLLSGSTDGYVNIYDLIIDEEDDALHQVINFGSIHSANFLSNKRIYTLSHIETLGIHELNDKSDELTEPKPIEFGDLRSSWDCEYVVDIYPSGYAACGSNSKNELKLFSFNSKEEKFDLNNPITFKGAHGDEVVRSVVCNGDVVYTGGEDSTIKIWNIPGSNLEYKLEFFTENDIKDEDGDIDIRDDADDEIEPTPMKPSTEAHDDDEEEEEGEEKDKKKEKKHKHKSKSDKDDKKHKSKKSKDKKHKSKKSKDKKRFKPY